MEKESLEELEKRLKSLVEYDKSLDTCDTGEEIVFGEISPIADIRDIKF